MNPASWGAGAWFAVLVAVVYCVVFAGIGIRWFKWTGR
jgi:hypothetical protein